MNNDYKAKDEKINREYVDKLIYENIRLADKNIMLEFNTKRLYKKIEQLERANKRLTEAALPGESAEQIIIFVKKKGHGNYN